MYLCACMCVCVFVIMEGVCMCFKGRDVCVYLGVCVFVSVCVRCVF